MVSGVGSLALASMWQYVPSCAAQASPTPPRYRLAAPLERSVRRLWLEHEDVRRDGDYPHGDYRERGKQQALTAKRCARGALAAIAAGAPRRDRFPVVTVGILVGVTGVLDWSYPSR